MSRLPSLIVLICVVAAFPAGTWAEGFPEFKEVVIDPNCGNVCYAVTLADVG